MTRHFIVLLIVLGLFATGGTTIGVVALAGLAGQQQRIDDLAAGSGPGTDGAAGQDGAAGSDGRDGADGADGRDGIDGKVGASGPAGAAGAQGPAGATGAAGPQGAVGPEGPTGATGSAGATGSTGAQGPAGATGATGPQGAAGQNALRHVDSFAWTEPGIQPLLASTPLPVTQGDPATLSNIRTTPLVTYPGGSLTFVVQYTGIYLVSYGLHVQTPSRIEFAALRNGTDAIAGSYSTAGASDEDAGAAFYAQLQAGDVVQITAVSSGSGVATIFPSVSFQAIEVPGLS
jgi:hypothetical protein